jgi:hypothetical protein
MRPAPRTDPLGHLSAREVGVRSVKASIPLPLLALSLVLPVLGLLLLPAALSAFADDPDDYLCPTAVSDTQTVTGAPGGGLGLGLVTPDISICSGVALVRLPHSRAP